MIGVGYPCDGCDVMCNDCLHDGTGNCSTCLGCLARRADPIGNGAWRVKPEFWGWHHGLYVADDEQGPVVQCAICGTQAEIGLRDIHWFACESLGGELEREVRS
jgi:hypothetical protein